MKYILLVFCVAGLSMKSKANDESGSSSGSDSSSDSSSSSTICLSNPCQNNSTCIGRPWFHDYFESSSSNNKEYVCICQDGYNGYECQNCIDGCQRGNNCQNGATCSTTSCGEYNCTCTPDFTGKYCQIPINPCLRSRCQNSGVCNALTNGTYSSKGSYNCTCATGFIGSNCQWIESPCRTLYRQNVCPRGRICVILANNTVLYQTTTRGDTQEILQSGKYECV